MIESKKKFIKSFICSSIALLIGIFIELAIGQSTQIWKYPLNIMLIASLIFLIGFTHLYYKKSKFYHFTTHIYSTLGTLSVTLILLLALGFIPQETSSDPKSLSNFSYLYHNITTSIPFSISLFILLYILGLVILKKKPQKTIRYLSFQLNHISLWIAIAVGIFGAPDKEEYKIIVEPGQIAQHGYTNTGIYQKVPVSLMLNNFTIDRYPDILAILHKENNTITETDTLEIQSLSTDYQIDGKDISILEQGNSHIKLTSTKKKDTLLLSKNQPFAPWDETKVIAWKQGKPRHYKAQIALEYKKEIFQKNIEINMPLIIDDYYLYLESYDFKQDNKLPIVILRLVKDPWYKIMHLALWGILIGAGLLIFVGPVYKTNNIKIDQND
ncbi:MAG: cytochrome c biogenesis protein ResB [Bacteroidales bacterium]